MKSNVLESGEEAGAKSLRRSFRISALLGAILLIGLAFVNTGCNGCNPSCNPPPVPQPAASDTDPCAENYTGQTPPQLPTTTCAGLCPNLEGCLNCAGRMGGDRATIERRKCRDKYQNNSIRDFVDEGGFEGDGFIAPLPNSVIPAEDGPVVIVPPLGPIVNVLPGDLLMAIEQHGLMPYLLNFDTWLSLSRRQAIHLALSSLSAEEQTYWSSQAINSLPYFQSTLEYQLLAWGWSPYNPEHVNLLLYQWFKYWLGNL